MCLDTIHRSYGVFKTEYHKLDIHDNYPFFICNTYTYHVGFKDPDYPESLIQNYDLVLYVKYGLHPDSYYIRHCYFEDDITPDEPMIKRLLFRLRHTLWYRMSSISLNFRRSRRPGCSCIACCAKHALFQHMSRVLPLPLRSWDGSAHLLTSCGSAAAIPSGHTPLR